MSLEANYKGVFDGSLGFGSSPALLIIDFVKAYTTPGFPLFAEGVVTAVKETVSLLHAAREKGLPIVYTQVLYNPNHKDGGLFVQKVPVLKTFLPGEPMTQIVAELAPLPSDVIITKQYASAFFGTNLASTLTALAVDTVIITGCSTSGCVRASAVDCLQHGFRPIVPKECVGDRHQHVHDANLFDVNSKYGDVVTKETVLQYLRSLPSHAPVAKKARVEAAPALAISLPPATPNGAGGKKRRDQLGWRKKFGVVIPSTNTIVEADFYRMGRNLPGVIFHFGLIHITSPNLSSDSHALNLLEQIRADIDHACTLTITAEPDWMICGMSGETFVGGKEGNAQFHARVQAASKGRGVSTGADACARAFECFGVKKLGVVTPYQPVFDAEVRNYFESMGFEVLSIVGLKCDNAIAIAEVTEDELRAAFVEANVPGVECLVQVGTNLSCVGVAEEAEHWLGKPVIAINAATLWHALRANGINDKIYGAGRLLREF